MELLKVKTARFRDIVAKAGQPEIVTLWQEPKKNPAFQRAQRENRVMSVHQSVTGTKKDFGEVGYLTGANISYLVFPKSLKAFADRRIVGIDYSLLPQLEPFAGEEKPAKKPRPGTAKLKTEPRKKPTRGPQFEIVRNAPDEESSNDTSEPEPQLDPFMVAAIREAQKGLAEGGIPIGSSLVRKGKLVGVGHNKRVQNNDPVTHAETDCLRNAGRIGSYRGCTLYSTLMPCYFCAGAAVQFGIKKVVVGESRNFPGAPEFMRAHGIEVIDLDLPECYEMMAKFIRDHPKLWNEDIGED